MRPNIPGYYYDSVKNKYFKIEKNHSAPANAAYSADAVKKRKLEDQARHEAQKRANLVKNHIRRHPISRDVVNGGLLARETEVRRVAESGRGRLDDRDIAAAAWARGVVCKGVVPFSSNVWDTTYVNLPCFYVGGEDAGAGLGFVYTTLGEETLVGCYMPTNENDEIEYHEHLTGTSPYAPSLRPEMIRCPQMSSIKYHSPSHKMILTSRDPSDNCGLYFFSPPRDCMDKGRYLWRLGETEFHERFSIPHGTRNELFLHESTPAPESSNLVCVVGTNSGLLKVGYHSEISWITPGAPIKGTHFPREIFTQDFQADNHNVLFTGGRQARLWTIDFRAPVAQSHFIKTQSSIDHIRSVNPNHVLVAGLQNSMALYDMRFVKKRPNGPKPLLLFPEHHNAAHLHLGWDVNPRLGVVAAAQDDGTVQLFSLRSGRRVQSTAVNSLKADTPLKALMFSQMVGEKLPSLFVGIQGTVRKYGFGVEHLDDEG